MPEISGPDSVLIDPYDEDSLKTGLETILSHRRHSATLSDRVRAFAQDFTWDISVAKFEAIVFDLLGERNSDY